MAVGSRSSPRFQREKSEHTLVCVAAQQVIPLCQARLNRTAGVKQCDSVCVFFHTSLPDWGRLGRMPKRAGRLGSYTSGSVLRFTISCNSAEVAYGKPPGLEECGNHHNWMLAQPESAKPFHACPVGGNQTCTFCLTHTQAVKHQAYHTDNIFKQNL